MIGLEMRAGAKVGWIGGRGRGGSPMKGRQRMSAWEGHRGIGCGDWVRWILHPYQGQGTVELGGFGVSRDGVVGHMGSWMCPNDGF